MIQNSKSPTISTIPEAPGIYRFLDSRGIILYIGKAKNLKKRVGSYFQKSVHDRKTNALVGQIRAIDFIPVVSEFESLLLEANLINRHKPKYNVIWKDDKHYIYIKISNEQYPRILISRKESKGDGTYFGPFPSSRTVRSMLSYIRTIFPFCTQSPHIHRPCFYTHIGLCDPCPAAIRLEKGREWHKAKQRAYKTNINNIVRLLSGRHDRVIRQLAQEMQEFSKSEEYEKAAEIRNRIRQLNYLIQNYTDVNVYMDNPTQAANVRQNEARMLKEILQEYYPEISSISRIECYDISNVSGKYATGSMVTFQGGEPDKARYRRFRIRTKTTPDDFAMLKEVLERRLKHADWNLPDLFVIDGGVPQLRALHQVLKQTFTMKTPVIGLAKQFEEIVVPVGDGYKKIRLPGNAPALHLLQRIRNEAHRFARKYHHLLHIKALLEDTG